MKRLTAILVALMLLVSIGATALAGTVTEDTGKITVENVVPGTTLALYQILDYDVNNDNIYNVTFVNQHYKTAFIAVIESFDNGAFDTAATPGEPTNYEVFQWITDYLTNNTPADGAALADALGNKIQVDCIDAETPVVPAIEAPKEITADSGEDTIVFDGLTFGYYLIIDRTPIPQGEENQRTVAVMVDAVSGTDVVLLLKSKTFTIPVKEAEESNYAIGNTVEYTITLEVPNYTKYDTNQSFKIWDIMDAALDFEGITSVTNKPTTGNGIQLAASDYIIEYEGMITKSDSTEVTIGGASGNKGFIITIDDITIYDVGSTLEIIYTAKINNLADDEGNGIINEIGTDQNGSVLEGEDVTVYTYGFELTKEDEAGNQLKGVGFKVYKLVDDDENAATPDVKMYMTQNDTSKVVGWTDMEGDGTEFFTDANGQIKVFGLDTGTYFLTETTVLPGYNPLNDDIEFTIEDTDVDGFVNQTIGVDNNVDESPYYNLGVIINVSGINLPGTGGIGTALFTAFGGAAILLGAAFLFANKKKLFN